MVVEKGGDAGVVYVVDNLPSALALARSPHCKKAYITGNLSYKKRVFISHVLLSNREEWRVLYMTEFEVPPANKQGCTWVGHARVAIADID